jgi:hypothetical protein
VTFNQASTPHCQKIIWYLFQFEGFSWLLDSGTISRPLSSEPWIPVGTNQVLEWSPDRHGVRM